MKDLFKKFKIIRSNRRSFAAEIGRNGLIVRVPQSAGEKEIRYFIEKHRDWIEKHAAEYERRVAANAEKQPVLTREEIAALAKKALEVIPERVRFFAPKVGVSYGRITIRSQRSKWGSCSSKGNLNFNCLLMLMPPEVVDSVVVHELCHRKEMNHSPRFYAEVRRVMPDYDTHNAWLRQHGAEIMRRLTGE